MQLPFAKKPPASPTPSLPSGHPSPPFALNSRMITNLFVTISLSPGQIVLNMPRWRQIWQTNESLNSRSIAHGVIGLLMILAIGLRGLPITWQQMRAIQPITQSPPAPPLPEPLVNAPSRPLILPATIPGADDDVLHRAAVPHTIIPDRSREAITTYTVQSGDTIFGIAAKLGLAPETLLWANTNLESNPDWLNVGQELTILPVDGVYHQVGGSDTVEGIAASYKVSPAAIIDYSLNQLDPDNPVITAGQWLVVPGGTKPFVPRTVTAYSSPVSADATTGTGAFGWPASGSISQGYWSGHPAIDIAAWIGAPVTAADSGQVIFTGWDDTGYGYTVVVDHGNGFQTLYAHLNAYYVNPGENVAKGQTIAEMGNTGNSTGPHLHLEIRHGTVQRNPLGFLP